jgi:ParB family chromosome partitioning protein
MLINIDQIKISDRIRKDFGNIQELADDIKNNGLINPPVLTPDYILIAGERRTKACKLLGYNQIEVRIMTVRDYEHQLRLEISENENRKEFSFSERVEWAKRLEQVEKIKAKENMSKGGKGLQNIVNLDSNEITAKESGFGNKETYRQAKFILENADPEIIKQLDEKQISIHSAYQKLKSDLDQKDKALIQATEKIKQLNTVQNKLGQIEQELNNKDTKIKRLEEDKSILERKVKLNEKEAEEYKQLKISVSNLKEEKSDLHRQIESITSISGLVADIEHTLQNKLAPIKYSRAIEEQKTDKIVIKNLKEIINRVQSWCDEMYKLIPEENYINVEVIYNE